MPNRSLLDQLCAAFGQASPGERARLLAGIARLLLRQDTAARAS